VRAAQALSTLAREAVGLLDAANADRIRACDATDCAMVFYDESRSNNRRWCSMQRCGNRAKVRKHRASASNG
jgi:predicted RNA-binding Zn ribbon-like protein